MTMTFTDSRELHRSILANPYLPAHLREQAANDRSEYCRAEDDDDLLEIDRLTDPGLVRFLYRIRQRIHARGRAGGYRPQYRLLDSRPYERMKEEDQRKRPTQRDDRQRAGRMDD